ncbi:MAG: RsmB/NOP family class I SAM-dependent RNA methyltransferase [Pseudobdellovibrionaceae bacterium]
MTQAPLPPSAHLSQPSAQPDLYDSGSVGPSGGDILQARKVALAILQDIFVKRHTLDQAFDDQTSFARLETRDRSFVRMMVATVIRRLGQIDDLIRRALVRPDQPLNPPVLEYILRLGVAQLVFMNIPDHAAVNTSVQLVEAEGQSRMKGFVNAILRRIAAEGKDWTTRQDIPRLNTPEWLLKIWINDYGLKGALDIAMANLNEAALDLTLAYNEDARHWADQLEADVLPTRTLRLRAARLVQDLPGYQAGVWWVQDAAAALPATLFGTLGPDDVVVDLCAAPGGKTAQLAAQGARVLAVDRSAKRLLRLQENMKRLGFEDQVKTEVADASVWRTRENVPFILLDAPCSATGTVRRNPDVIWMKSHADLRSLVDLQAKLLVNAVSMLMSGGILVYCTCSLQKEEGEQQIEKLLEQRPDIERVPIHASEIGGLGELITPRGDIRILPYHLLDQGGMDGFFVARLRKR